MVEPTPEARAECVDVLLDGSFNPEAVESTMSILGVPQDERHPPKRKRYPKDSAENDLSLHQLKPRSLKEEHADCAYSPLFGHT